MDRAMGVSVLVAFFTCAALNAQAPHGGQTTAPQPGPNVNAVGGIADPKDPAALVKADLNLQRQNETVVAASTRNPDHVLAAANDYRFVDFPQDQYYGGAQNFFTRLLARIFGRPGQRVPPRAAAAVGAWTGVYRSCDRGRTWIGSALPGSPLDFSDASRTSALKSLSDRAALQGGHAETTDPVMVAGPGGRMHLVVLGFVRFPNGSVGESHMYYASYTDRNNLEGGSCFTYDFMQEIDTGAAYTTLSSPAPFIDKPAVAVDKDGTLYAAYTVFADTVKSKIVVARSTNGGGTWTKTIPLLNLGFLRNHGTALTVDPLDGTVYVAWRMFYDNWPLMVISKSYDKGRTFFPATPISNFWPSRSLQQIIDQLKAAKLQPFDQFSGEPGDPPTARALAFPSIVAGVVNGKSKLFAVWTERADVDPRSPTWGLPSASGSPRIMISMSSDGGWSWTARRALDAGPRTENLDQPGVGALITRPSGPQLQPVLGLSGTTNAQLLVMYYEAREELDAPFATNFISGIERMMDVRTARIDPVTGTLLAPSVQVSQYPVKANSSPAALPEIAPGYRMGNRQNLTMYAGGTTAFIGDYPGLAASQPFEFKSGRWNWSADPGPALAIWTDNRDVAFPLNANGQSDINGAWANYQPLVPTDPLAPAATDCSFVASRNSNPYFSEIGGVIAGAPQTFKPLTIQRAFATYVENRTSQDRFFRLTIQDNERQGIDGSFDQFDFGPAAEVRDVKVFANSSHHRTIWVQPRPQAPTASLSMLVQETVTLAGALKADGYRTRVVLNPDPDNDALTTVPPQAAQYAGNPAITADSSELHNPQISSPQISTFRVSAPQISSPQISSPQISTPQISSPQISSPQISSPQISSPQISTPQISTAPPDEQNGTDVTYTVRNEGTTWTTYDALFNVPDAVQLIGSGNYQFQVLITRTSLVPAFARTAGGCSAAARQEVHVLANIPVPQISSPQISTISNPQISSPQISSPQIATFSLAPSGGAAVSQPDGANPDSHSPIIPDEVQVTVRAIALKPRAEILASGRTLFNPATVEAKVTSASTNVVQGTVDAPGTQPIVVTRPDLVVASTPLPPGLSVPAGGAVSLSPVTVRNDGSQATAAVEGGTPVGYYLSIDPVITTEDTLLASDTVFSLPVAGEVTLDARTLTIPAATVPGVYYVGVLVDGSNVVAESDEGNNYVSAAITVTTAQLLTFVTQPSDTTARQPIVPAVQVAARDATGAGLPGVSITLTLAANPSEALLTGATAATNAFGVATFPTLAVSQAGSGYTLQANVVTQSSGPSVPFNITGAGALVCGEAAFDTSQLAAHRVQPDPRFVAVADFNRDGRGDIVTANVGSNDVSVLLANASGGFGDPANYPVGGSPAGLAIGDFNRDGHPDIAVARSNAPTVVVLSGNATGAFGAATSYPVGNLAGVLTAADVNEDGRLDLVIAAAEAGDGTGRLTLLAGTAAGGFSAPVAVAAGGPSSLPAAIATADLNADGHVDVIVSNHGEDNVSVFLGDGAGGFASRVTYADGGGALAVGDFTSDGRPDVAVVQSHGTSITFLRGSTSGALTPGTPLTLAAEGRAIVAADIDGDGNLDLAAVQAEGFSTFLGNGDGGFGAERTLDPNSEPRALAVSDFNNDGKADVVVANGTPADAVTFLTNVCVAGPRQLVVTNTNDGGAGSLRDAMFGAERNSGFRDSILFNIPGPGVHTIVPQTGLPLVADPIIIDGTSQPGYAGLPLIELDGSNTSLSMGFLVRGGGSIFRGLAINSFSEGGIAIDTVGGNVIEGMFIGTDATGTIALPNRNFGIAVVETTNNTIGGPTAGARNLISGNAGVGIQVSGATASGNIIAGNIIGADITGTVAVGNTREGVAISGANNTVGGATSAHRNLISGNASTGVAIGVGAHGNSVEGNYIGTTLSGAAALSNACGGVLVDRSSNNTVVNNVISGNGCEGVRVQAPLFPPAGTGGNVIKGNLIGLNASGTAAMPNVSGVIINAATNNTIGGADARDRNVISGNTTSGIGLLTTASGNTIQGNLIGTDVSGTIAIGNQHNGVFIEGPANIIGGASAGARNVISGNTLSGIQMNPGANSTIVQGNFIGVDATGSGPLGNATMGVLIHSSDNVIGGTAAGARNVISANQMGVLITSQGALPGGNRIEGNFIGTNAAGTAALGNVFQGVVINEGANNHIGGPTAAHRNVISGNNNVGVLIQGGPSTGNRVEGNVIGLGAACCNINTVALPNLFGIYLASTSGNVVGFDAAGVGRANVVSGNNASGILLFDASGNTISGNAIGSDAIGDLTFANGIFGIDVQLGNNNVLGGTVGNLIKYNESAGIRLMSGTGNRIANNNISFNGRLGIDLEGFGATANDSGDGDQGPNDLQNYPVLTSADALGSTRVRGSLNSTPNSTFTLEVFRNAACDASGFGEGETSLGTVSVTTDATGVATFDANFGAAVTAGEFITATATNQSGSTSEFSNCVQAAANDPFTVSTTNDDGAGSLRAAILAANGTAGVREEIHFNIPGPGPHVIALVSPLPQITDPVFIDGASEPGYAGVPVIQLNGAIPIGASVGPGLQISAGNTRVRALSMVGFEDAITLTSSGNNVIDGNYIGLRPDGTAFGNSRGISVLSAQNRIGGPTAAERNVISGNTERGIEIRDAAATGNRVINNYIGTSPDGLSPRANGIAGILVDAASSNVIGEPGAGNVISGNIRGVSLGPGATNNRVAANLIGTMPTGEGWQANAELGIAVFGDANTIGGTNAGEGNVISANNAGGILITRALGGTGNGNFVYGNSIGLASDGTQLGNGGPGVSIQGGASNTIGGSNPRSRNLIGANGRNGIVIAGATATGNVIAGNYIGIDEDGGTTRPNFGAGVLVQNAGNNQIGVIGAGNVISGNLEASIAFDHSSGNDVVGNRIGTNADGTEARPNGFIVDEGGLTGAGITLVQSPGNRIGNAAPGGGNLISGNGTGIWVKDAQSPGTIIAGNLIGTNAAGNSAIPNGTGIAIAATGQIGGTQAGARNIISGNTSGGILVNSAGSPVTIQGNYIGTNIGGTQSVANGVGISVTAGGVAIIGGDRAAGAGNVIAGNTLSGITLQTDASLVGGNNIGTGAAGELTVGNGDSGIDVNGSNNVMGGSGGLYNIIGMNGGAGINVRGSQNNIQENVIFRNGGLGIDLGNDGVTANDAGDVDEAANRLQNFPVLATVTAFSAATRIMGTLNSTPASMFTLRFYANDTCDPSGHGEGQRVLGSTMISTDAAGNAPIDVTLPVVVGPGDLVTATATDSAGNTSEFSACQPTTEWSAFLPPGTAAEATTTNPRSGNGSLELVAERSNPVYINEPGGSFGTFGQLNALSFDWAIDPGSQGSLPPDLALRVYPADDPRTFFLHWETCSAAVLCSPRAKGEWQTTSLFGQLSIEPDFSRSSVPPASLAEIPADAPISGIHIRGNYSFGLPSFAYVDNVTIGFTGAPARVFNFELTNPPASRHRPSINWARPAAIAAGTPLSASELNATATAAGTFTYTPSAGTILPADLHELFVRFEAQDTSQFLPVSTLVPLTVTGPAMVLPDDPFWFTYLPTPGSFAAITTTNPRSGDASLELSKVAGSGSAYIHEFRGISFGGVSDLTALSMDWFIDPVSEGARPPQVALRVYEYGDPRSFFLFWDTCSEVTPCDPHPTGSWQSTNLIGKLSIQSADGNPPPASLADIPPDAPITGVHIRADFGFGGVWHGFADNLAIGFGGREPIVFNFETLSGIQH